MANTPGVDRKLARRQLHRMVRCLRGEQKATEPFRDALRYANLTGNGNQHSDRFCAETIDLQNIVACVEVRIDKPPVSVAPPWSVVKLHVNDAVVITVIIGNLEARHLSLMRGLTSSDTECRSRDCAW